MDKSNKKLLVIENYNSTKNRSETARQIGISKYHVFKILRDEGIECDSAHKRACTKYTLKSNIFNKIDSPEKAYWLGFISADGCITDRGALSIVLSASDEDMLILFLKFIGSNMKIKKFWRKSPSSEKIFEYCRINICSREMTSDLINHGIVPRKSLILKAPIISEDLQRFYILGYFDGDGGISYSNIKTRNNLIQTNITFTGTMETCIFINDYFKKYGFDGYIGKRMKNDINNYTLAYGGNNNIVFLLRRLYSGSENLPIMKRKYEKFQFLEEKLSKSKPNGFYLRDEKGNGRWVFDFFFKERYVGRGFSSKDQAFNACLDKMKDVNFLLGIERLTSIRPAT